MSMAWVAVGTAAAGIGASLYGANKQAKDTAGANNANIAAQQESERQNWLRYLMTRGVNPGANTQSGEVPGFAPGAPMNTKLPLWMKVMVPPQQAAPVTTASGAPVTSMPFLVRKG